MKNEIIQYLKAQNESKDVVDIARHIFDKKPVTDDECNTVGPILYRLTQAGILGKINGGPPFTLSRYYIPGGTHA